jgi:hypothetical protein
VAAGSTRDRSASPHTSAASRNGLPSRADSSRESRTLGSASNPPGTLSQLVERSIHLHPTLVEILNKYEHRSISYVRACRKGGAYLDGLMGLNDLEQDTLSLEFSETLNRTDRRRDEVQEGGRGEREKEGGEKAEVNRLDWGEVGGRERGI